MATQSITQQVLDQEGNVLETNILQIEVPSTEEMIAEKEAKLLKIYEELQSLKG